MDGEIRRVLAPGGVAVVSVHSPAAFGAFASGRSTTAIPAERIARHAPIEKAGFAYEEVAPSRWNALRFIDSRAGWGLAFHSEEWIRTHWEQLFGAVYLVRSGGFQDAVVLVG